MDYNRAALFVRVVKAGSFTAAGAQVGLPTRVDYTGQEPLGIR